MSDFQDISVQFQRLQTIFTEPDFSVLPNTFDVAVAIKNFKNNANFREINEKFAQLGNSGLIKSVSEFHSNLTSLSKIEISSSSIVKNKFNEFLKIDFSTIFSASSFLSTIDFAEVLKKSNPMVEYDYENIGIALQRVFNKHLTEQEKQSEEKSVVSLSMVAEEVQEEYNKIGTAMNDIQLDNCDLSDNKDKMTKISIIISIISLVFTVLFGTTQTILSFLSYKATVDCDNKFVEDTRNYIKNEVGIDAKSLNQLNYRMICWDNVMPRLCHDCRSRVTGHLEKGKVVIIVNHYKKWIEILWQNEDGEFCSGWIQNYKVVEFK